MAIPLILGGAMLVGSMVASRALMPKPVMPRATEPSRIYGLELQTSGYGKPIPILYGTRKIAGHLIRADNFQEHPHVERQRVGGGGKKEPSQTFTQTSYTYSVRMMLALCEGPIANLGLAWIDGQPVTGSITEWNYEVLHGNRVQAPWTALSTTITGKTETRSFKGTLVNNRVTLPEPALDVYEVRVTAFIAPVICKEVQSLPLTQLGQFFFTTSDPRTVHASGDQSGWVTVYYTVAAAVSTPVDQLPGFGGTAILANREVDLGSTATLKNHTMEVFGLGATEVVPYAGGPFGPYWNGPWAHVSAPADCQPANAIYDIITNAVYGAGMAACIDIPALENYRNYCHAAEFYLSPIIDAQRPLIQYLNEWLEATNSGAFWSASGPNGAGQLKIVPYGDREIQRTGIQLTSGSTYITVNYTYAPTTNPVYDLSNDDFVAEGDEDPITVERIPLAETFNVFPVEYSERQHRQYDAVTVEYPEAADVALHGKRVAGVTSLPSICRRNIAEQISKMKALRSIHVRNRYRFKLGWRFALLEPMDLVTLTEPNLGLDHHVVRIIAVEEDADGTITIEAEEWPIGIAGTTQLVLDYSDGNGDYGAVVLPGNAQPPQMAMVPYLHSEDSETMVLATCGYGSNWGGCDVYISWDALDYGYAGSLLSKSSVGFLNADLPAHPASSLDLTNTLTAGMQMSWSELVGRADAERDDFSFALMIADPLNPEIVSFSDVTAIDTHVYNCTKIRRGAYGTTRAFHPAGTPIFVLDTNVLQIAIPSQRLGQTLTVKLVSFNKAQGGRQDLATVKEYPFTTYAVFPPRPTSITMQVSSVAPAKGINQYRENLSESAAKVSLNDSKIAAPQFAVINWVMEEPLP